MAEGAQSLDLSQLQTKQTQEQQPRSFPWGKIFIYTILVVGVVLAIAPFLWMTSASLMNNAEISAGRILPAAPLFENYPQAWGRANFAQFMWNSVRITAITIIGLLVFCIPAAYAFARMKFIGRNILFTLMLSTMMIPEIATFIPNYLTVIWLGRFGQSVCGDVCAWINNWPALTVPFMATAFSIFLLRQFFAQIPDDLWDAAQIDGAGHLRFLLSVVIPLSTAPVMTIITFSFIGSWNALLWPLLVTTSDAWRPVSVGLTKFVNSDAPGEFALQMAASVIMILPILVMYFFTQKHFQAGTGIGSIQSK